MRTTLNPGRFPLLALGMFTLLAAMWAGLLRMGWTLPPLTPTLAGAHGPLMVSGFLGTVIGLERAVAMNKGWMYLAPVLTAVGAIATLAGLPPVVGALAITGGSLVLVCVFGYLVRHQPAMFTYVMALAAVLWLVSNGLWLAGTPIDQLAAWWAGFLLLTIAGERLELTRLLQLPDSAKRLFVVAVAIFLAGLITITVDFSLGWRITGAAMIAMALWLFKNDIAWRTVRQEGLTRFIAVCMISGYIWLFIAGALALWYGFLFGGPYDAVLHAVYLGFVFAMIFGHAPVIFPAVLGVTMRYAPRFYVHLAILHLSLLLRVGAGLADALVLRQWAALLNVAAILLFLANTVSSIKRD